MNSNLGRLLLAGGAVILVLLFAWEAFSDELHVIEVRRNIPLADNDPVYRDFYINAGPEAGLKPNLVVTALRKTHIKDATGTQSFGELEIPVGQLKIIFSMNHISVAREYKLLSRDDLPMLEQVGIMTGDLIDLKGSFIDNRKHSAKTMAREETAPAAPKAPAETPGPTETAKVETAAANVTAPSAAVPTPAAPVATKPATVEAATDSQAEILQSTAQAIERVSNKTE